MVGEHKKVFYLQPAVLRQGSSALAARVSEPWKNSGQGVIDWTDFDERTIDCVLRFCYGGVYDVPGQPPPRSTKRTSAEIQSSQDALLEQSLPDIVFSQEISNPHMAKPFTVGSVHEQSETAHSVAKAGLTSPSSSTCVGLSRHLLICQMSRPWK
jgi:hypothetical protein